MLSSKRPRPAKMSEMEIRGIQMTKTLHGTTIQLDEDPELPRDKRLKSRCEPCCPPHLGDGIRRSAGGWANDPEMDAAMEKFQRGRKLGGPLALLSSPSRIPSFG